MFFGPAVRPGVELDQIRVLVQGHRTVVVMLINCLNADERTRVSNKKFIESRLPAPVPFAVVVPAQFCVDSESLQRLLRRVLPLFIHLVLEGAGLQQVLVLPQQLLRLLQEGSPDLLAPVRPPVDHLRRLPALPARINRRVLRRI